MARPRLIPVILLKNGLIVRSEGFRWHQILGNPITTIARLSSWSVDELVLIDIGSEDVHDRRREDHAVRYEGSGLVGLLARHGQDACARPERLRARQQLGGDDEHLIGLGQLLQGEQTDPHGETRALHRSLEVVEHLQPRHRQLLSGIGAHDRGHQARDRCRVATGVARRGQT